MVKTMPILNLYYNETLLSSHMLEQGVAFIGPGRNSTIEIDSQIPCSGIKHAVVRRYGTTTTVTPLSPTQLVLVNQQTIDKGTTLSQGDIIQLGPYKIIFQSSEADRPCANTSLRNKPDQALSAGDIIPRTDFEQIVNSIDNLPTGYIQVLDGEHIGKVIALQRSLTRLGLNGNECAVIARRDDGFYLSHLEGSTPPLINQRSIGNRSVALKEGHIISLGDTRMRFHEEIGQSAEIEVQAKPMDTLR